MTVLTDHLSAVLERAVGAGVITSDQATAIRRMDSAENGTPTQLPPGASTAEQIGSRNAAVEIAAYVGALLALTGLLVLIGRAWESIGFAVRVAIPAAVTLLLVGARAALGSDDDPVRARLRAVLGGLAAIGTAATMAVLTVDRWDLDAEAVAVLIGGATFIVSAAMWASKPRPVQQVTSFVSLQLIVGAVASWLQNGGVHAGFVGIAIAAVGVGWLIAAMARLLPPHVVAVAIASVSILIGVGVAAARWGDAGPVAGLAVAIVLIAVGALRREPVALAIGVVGMLVYVPWALGSLFGDAIGPAAVLLASGVALLVLAVTVMRPAFGRARQLDTNSDLHH